MSNSGSAGSQHDSDNSTQDLYSLLKDQVENYQQMLKLEEELSARIKEKAFGRISQNTKLKAELMEQIIKRDSEIAPAIAAQIGADGALPAAKAEALRKEAIALVEKLQEMETENRAGLEQFRDSMTQNFREAKQAKRAAHGYKQTKSIYRSRHDTRR